ncbi:MAG: hypothetical protein ACOYJ6_18625 [Caulobacterales bacterium]
MTKTHDIPRTRRNLLRALRTGQRSMQIDVETVVELVLGYDAAAELRAQQGQVIQFRARTPKGETHELRHD